MNLSKAISYLSLIMAVSIITGCMGASTDSVVKKFIIRCESGDWSGAETMLSGDAKLSLSQSGKSLEQTYWPILGLASIVGAGETIRDKFDTAIIIVSDDSSTTRGSVRIKVNNSNFIGAEASKSIANSVGLESLDVMVKIDLIQESNRWKIDRITPQGTDEEREKWAKLAEKSPTSLGL